MRKKKRIRTSKPNAKRSRRKELKGSFPPPRSLSIQNQFLYRWRFFVNDSIQMVSYSFKTKSKTQTKNLFCDLKHKKIKSIKNYIFFIKR